MWNGRGSAVCDGRASMTCSSFGLPLPLLFARVSRVDEEVAAPGAPALYEGEE